MSYFLKTFISFFPGLTILLFSLTLNAASQPISGPRVLYINSCNSSEKWNGGILDGFREHFYSYAPNAVLDIADLNCRSTKNFQPDTESIRHLGALLQNNRYDLILAVGNPAADLFLEKKLQLSSKTPVVFCGYDTSGKTMRTLPPGTTGLLLPSYVPLNIELGVKLFPETGTIAILTGMEPGDVRIDRVVSKESARFPGVRFLTISGKTYDTRRMLSTLKALPENSLVIFHDWTTSESSAPVPPASILKRIREIYAGPILCSQDNVFGEKVLGGIMAQGKEHGKEAAALALRMLASGEASVQQPIVGTARCVIDYPLMKKYGIDPGVLPNDVLFPGSSESVWNHYHPFLFIALSIFMLIALIYAIISRRDMRREQRRQKIIYDALSVRIVVIDADRNVRFHQVHSKVPY